MAAFLTENLATILIAAVLVAAAVLALVWTLKNRKKNACGCSSCDGCASRDSCRLPEKGRKKY